MNIHYDTLLYTEIYVRGGSVYLVGKRLTIDCSVDGFNRSPEYLRGKTYIFNDVVLRVKDVGFDFTNKRWVVFFEVCNSMWGQKSAENIIKALVKSGYWKEARLEELLSKVTPDNVHPEVDTGTPLGKEAEVENHE